MSADGEPKKLKPKHQRFVDEYLVDLNATQAAIRAGYSEKTAGSQGHDLLKKPEIQEAIAQAKAKLAGELELTPQLVLKELARLAFMDIRKAFNPDGSLKPLDALDDNTAAAIAGLEAEDVFEGRGPSRKKVGRLHKIKLADKNRALDSLARYLGMLVDRHEHTGKDGDPIDLGLDLKKLTDAQLDQLENIIAAGSPKPHSG